MFLPKATLFLLGIMVLTNGEHADARMSTTLLRELITTSEHNNKQIVAQSHLNEFCKPTQYEAADPRSGRYEATITEVTFNDGTVLKIIPLEFTEPVCTRPINRPLQCTSVLKYFNIDRKQYETRTIVHDNVLLRNLTRHVLTWIDPQGDSHEVTRIESQDTEINLKQSDCSAFRDFDLSLNGCRFEAEDCRRKDCQGFYVVKSNPSLKFRISDFASRGKALEFCIAATSSLLGIPRDVGAGSGNGSASLTVSP